VAAPRPTRPRLIVGAAAVAATLATGALALAEPGPLVPVVAGLVGLAVVAALVGVVGGRAAWGSVTAGLLGAGFVATLHDRPAVVDARTPVMAAAVLLVAELVTWAAEQRTAGTVVPGAVPRPIVLLGCGLGAYLLGLLLTSVVALPIGRDLALTALGAAAVAGVTAVLVTVARSRATG